MIHLALNINAFHSNLPAERQEDLNDAKGGLSDMGSLGIPFSLSYHGIDPVFYPWLPKLAAQFSSIEVFAAPWAHPLFALVDPGHQKWQLERGANVGARTWFFPDYLPPEAHCLEQLPGDSFLLSPRFASVYRCVYDTSSDTIVPGTMQSVISGESISWHKAIRHGGKIGLVMKGQNDFIGAFFEWTRNPAGLDETERLVNEILRVGRFGAPVIAGIDFEAAWIGSFGGAETWKAFFELILRNNLEEHFVALSSVEASFQDELCPAFNQIHAATGDKWTKYPEQVQYAAHLMNFTPRTENEHIVFAIAASSDVLSRMHSLMEGSRGTVLSFDTRGFDGSVWRADLSRGNDDIIPLGFAAQQILLGRGNEATLHEWAAHRMKQKPSSFFLRRFAKFAKERGL